MKVCSKCNGTKPLAEFARRKASSDGRQSWCKECQLAYKAENRSRIDAQNAAYRVEHREKTAAYDVVYRAANRERITKREAAYRTTNRDWIAARKADWRADNRERIAEQKADYRAAHREEIAERDARYHSENRERISARSAAYRAVNPHITWANNYAKRARKIGREPVIEEFTKADVVERYGDACAYCNGDFQHLDHYMPVSKGGPHTLANVRPSCVSCNSAKGDLPGEEFEVVVDAVGR